jgi:hypothetical protein
MRYTEQYYANSRTFLRLAIQFQNSKIRQSRLLRRSLDEIKFSSSIATSRLLP